MNQPRSSSRAAIFQSELPTDARFSSIVDEAVPQETLAKRQTATASSAANHCFSE